MPVLRRNIKCNNEAESNLCTISPKMNGLRFWHIKNRYRSASLTAEAALAFPVFFFTVFMLWQLFLFLLFQMRVCHAVTDTAIKYAHLGYAERKAQEQEVDISWLYQPLFWNALPEHRRVKDMWVFCFPKENGTIQVQVGYQFVCESVFFADFAFPVRQKFQFFPYLGETDADLLETGTGGGGGSESQKDIVYMTEYGTVYHESRACGYLNVVVRSVAASRIEEARNSAGKKYTLCERCDNRELTTTVYISDGGIRYHLTAGCPALKRTIMEKTRDEVTGVPACHKCGNRKEGGTE